jgi:hypothetical protein
VLDLPATVLLGALRQKIIEECTAIEWEQDASDWRGLPMCTPESSHHACRALELIFEEQGLLAKHGIEWRLYNTYQLD